MWFDKQCVKLPRDRHNGSYMASKLQYYHDDSMFLLVNIACYIPGSVSSEMLYWHTER